MVSAFVPPISEQRCGSDGTAPTTHDEWSISGNQVCLNQFWMQLLNLFEHFNGLLHFVSASFCCRSTLKWVTSRQESFHTWSATLASAGQASPSTKTPSSKTWFLQSFFFKSNILSWVLWYLVVCSSGWQGSVVEGACQWDGSVSLVQSLLFTSSLFWLACSSALVRLGHGACVF